MREPVDYRRWTTRLPFSAWVLSACHARFLRLSAEVTSAQAALPTGSRRQLEGVADTRGRAASTRGAGRAFKSFSLGNLRLPLSDVSAPAVRERILCGLVASSERTFRNLCSSYVPFVNDAGRRVQPRHRSAHDEAYARRQETQARCRAPMLRKREQVVVILLRAFRFSVLGSCGSQWGESGVSLRDWTGAARRATARHIKDGAGAGACFRKRHLGRIRLQFPHCGGANRHQKRAHQHHQQID
jgi:hypothetical protein